MSDCIEWQGNIHHGYGRIMVNGIRHQAHRIAWQKVNGPIPEGLHVLHECDNPPCVNPDHLFLGTQADNNRDMTAKGRHWQAQKTHCSNGHPFNEENTYHWHGYRQCKTCKRDQSREYQRKKRAAVLTAKESA